ncbi:MAG TPA: hypothetical protein VMT73_03250 [Anaerolineales bacterium]|nr:hypothetical protein [Anaerolineales bacterium]
MEIKELVFALERTLYFLRQSQPSVWSRLSCEEAIGQLEIQLDKIKNSGSFDLATLKILFAPTGPLQEISISSNWSNEFIELSKTIDPFVDSK